jgi:predicted transcriptional regulator
MFTGANESAYGPARKKFQDMDKDLKPHVLFYKGEVSLYKKELAMEDKDKPYFFVLDKEGKIIYTTSGAYSETKMEQIEELVSEE